LACGEHSGWPKTSVASSVCRLWRWISAKSTGRGYGRSLKYRRPYRNVNGPGEAPGWLSFHSLLALVEPLDVEAPAARNGSIGGNTLACLRCRTARDLSEPALSDLARYELRERDKGPPAFHGCGCSIPSIDFVWRMGAAGGDSEAFSRVDGSPRLRLPVSIEPFESMVTLLRSVGGGSLRHEITSSLLHGDAVLSGVGVSLVSEDANVFVGIYMLGPCRGHGLFRMVVDAETSRACQLIIRDDIRVQISTFRRGRRHPHNDATPHLNCHACLP